MEMNGEQAAVWVRLRDHDLTDVERWYAEKKGLPRSHAIEVSRELRRYVFLCWLDGDAQRNGMTDCAVDDFWHFFLTFTPDYRRFCTETVGFAVDHNPALYWRPEVKPTTPARHVFSARLYEKIFGHKPPRRFWQHVEAGATEPATMPGALSGNAQVLTPDGSRLVAALRPGDALVSAAGAMTRVAWLAAWPVADTPCVRYPGHDWHFTSNLVLHGEGDHRAACDPDLVVAADGARFLADGERGVGTLTWRYVRERFAPWPGLGLVPHTPSPRDIVWFVAAPGGFRVRGGLRVFGSMEVSS